MHIRTYIHTLYASMQYLSDDAVIELDKSLDAAGLGIDMTSGTVTIDAEFLRWCDTITEGFEPWVLKSFQYYGPKRVCTSHVNTSHVYQATISTCVSSPCMCVCVCVFLYAQYFRAT
jgi:hypothetical protein